MSKPWDDEPSPVVDGFGHNTAVVAVYFQDMERRLRHAEKVMAMLFEADFSEDVMAAEKLMIAHLQAAREDDCEAHC